MSNQSEDALKEIAEKIERFLHEQADMFSPGVFFLGMRYQEGMTKHGADEPVSEPASEPAAERHEQDTPVKPIPVMQDAPSDEHRGRLLDEFYQEIKDCQKCALAKGRTHLVFGAGNPNATLMFVGEGPGRDEDLQGLPFVGPAGRVLDRMIKRLGFERDEVYIANIVKCRPPQNRDPLPEEVEACFPYLQRQIDIIQPKFIFCLGRVAAHAMFGHKAELATLRGRIHYFRNSKVIVTYHPAALLRNQKLFWATFEDMKLFRKLYDQEVGDKPPMENQNQNA
ncbi:MAG: uracil-DNA glycosylase [candidate division KSB1 bacterium]|nr:uracil-DNA glycosylase [candidate division KSB1 bacterium]